MKSQDVPTAAAPVLDAVARVVRSRPISAHLPGGPDWLVRNRLPWLLEILRRFPAVRARTAENMADAWPDEQTRSLAALLLSPDNAVVEAAIDALDLASSPAKDRAAQRTARNIAELRKRLAAERQRREYAEDDVQKAERLLTETRDAKADLEERVDKLNRQLAIEHHRFQEPQAVAAALLHILEQPPSPPKDDSAARDPHNEAAPPGQYNGTLLEAAKATALAPEKLLDAVRAMIAPAPPPVRVTRELDLRVTPLGGDTEIGGSCLLVEAGGTRLLVDAGLRPGEQARPPRAIEQAMSGDLHGVVVTHAHNDHCGYVPAMVSRHPGLRVLATAETVRLMPVMWSDTAKLMRGRTRQLNRWGAGGTMLYGPPEVDAAAARCEEVTYGVPRRIGELTVELFPAGHILGAAGAVIRAGDRRVVVTGDISGFSQESVDGYALPDSAVGADLLVMESTCCGENHDDRARRVGDFIREVREIYQNGGRVLIPAFALGRAQEVALLMRRHLPEVPVRIDGMAVELTNAFETATATSARPLKVFGPAVTPANRPAELDTFRNGVVITTSGMLTGGPAVQWAARILPESGSALFLSGYQDEESPGAQLRQVPEAGGKFTLPDHSGVVTVSVRARVAALRLSAHADRRGLLDIADEVSAGHTMLVHGAQHRQRRFREILRVRDHETTETALWRPNSRSHRK
ncbi:MBL fold metallo-hydrolase [Actinomadura mexicana]|uniref:RNA processing exonuclease, beta-lactamase fold, Cft2 family n=1 Tax=Actinomadura mexicana TaxID=134959 RepID=A0A238VPJ3_9ACTN|nr:MBL fold metallo-hydrolase [Actinomadura mexicana]SNR36074.1 RNA processing exonuclease, beta-lactamase fold, Cft2 family [Actinomadura mexicana]